MKWSTNFDTVLPHPHELKHVCVCVFLFKRIQVCPSHVNHLTVALASVTNPFSMGGVWFYLLERNTLTHISQSSKCTGWSNISGLMQGRCISVLRTSQFFKYKELRPLSLFLKQFWHVEQTPVVLCIDPKLNTTHTQTHSHSLIGRSTQLLILAQTIGISLCSLVVQVWALCTH